MTKQPLWGRLMDQASQDLKSWKPEELQWPSDDKLMDIARATDLVYYMGEDCGFASPYMEETDITAGVIAFAREVLARYGGSTSSSTEA